jgi:NarL family two-component system response regulator LiaR
VAETIRLILADDHALLRQGTAELLNHEPDLEIVGEAEDGQQAIELAQRLKPDIVVMDVRMPVLSGIEATRTIRETVPDCQIIVLTAHEDDQYVFSLLQAGASGYLLKSSQVSELINGIRQVHEGRSPLDPAIAKKIVSRIAGKEMSLPDPEVEGAPAEHLTPRELDVLQLLARGLSNRAIAQELVISERTVQAHLTSIFAKMAVSSRTEAVLSAIRMGWLSLSD